MEGKLKVIDKKQTPTGRGIVTFVKDEKRVKGQIPEYLVTIQFRDSQRADEFTHMATVDFIIKTSDNAKGSTKKSS